MRWCCTMRRPAWSSSAVEAHASSSYVSEAAGLAEAVGRTRPRVCFFGHHHHRVDAEINGIRCIGLNKVARTG